MNQNWDDWIEKYRGANPRWKATMWHRLKPEQREYLSRNVDITQPPPGVKPYNRPVQIGVALGLVVVLVLTWMSL